MRVCIFFLLWSLGNPIGAQTISFEWSVTTLAGPFSNAPGDDDGTGDGARFRNPNGIAIDASGNVYTAELIGHRIRKITPEGTSTTLAGSGTGGYADGTGTSASFNAPAGVAVDASGNVYVADAGNNRIRKITPAGVVTTLAGDGTADYADGTGTAAQFWNPRGITLDGAGNLYVADSHNHRIRKITPEGVVTTLAGTGIAGHTDGAGTNAQFYIPSAVAADGAGNVYVTDFENHRIRKITPSGVVTTLAGDGTEGFADGTGTAAKFNRPSGITVDASGNLYISDRGNQRIRKVTPAGTVSTIAGISSYGSQNGPASSARFYHPWGIGIDANHNLYVADEGNHKIRKLSGASLNPFSYTYQSFYPNNEQMVYISGQSLTHDLVITAPPGYLFSLQEYNPWGGSRQFHTTLTLTPVAGIISPQSVYIIMSQNSDAGIYNGNLSISSSGATTRTIALNGTILKGDQTISTFYMPDPLPSKNIGDLPFELYANASSGLPVVYTSSDPSVATISGNVLTITGGGTTNITVSQPGNHNYNPASAVVVPFTVTKADQTITFNTLSTKIIVDAPFSLTASTSSGLPVVYTSSDPAVATISGNTVTLTGTGTTEITASQPGNASYNAATPQVQTLEVTKASQVITFILPSGIGLSEESVTLNGTINSGLSIIYTSSNPAVATVSGNILTLVGTGTSIITASQPGDHHYNAATDVVRTIDVNNKLSQTITFEALANRTTGDAPFALNAVSTSGLTITYTSSNPLVATVSGNILTIVGAGTTTVTASQPGNTEYNPAPEVIQPLIISAPATGVSTATNLISTLYPNPATEHLCIESSTGITGPVSLTITDIQGAVLFHSFVNIHSGKYQLDVSSFTSGMYWLELGNDKQKIRHWFVKQ